ncbi:SRPBCC domain-containing protein [Nocardiopsis ganjiahuensis]|uniref:SRPBCC domain-containing protein n=1 Tax=Nocardiopsis ganjiahuensis TaxID=239984 RepID=UPI00034AFB22|nr:SRPBCC domain-containing protein [Nocardiopsis ganjiahuensis]
MAHTGNAPALHGTFTLDYPLKASPDAVFAAFSQLNLRKLWSRLPGPSASSRHELDFRVGGIEHATNTFPGLGGPEELESLDHFHDIVPERRIVYTHTARVNGLTRWVSLATVELTPEDTGTLLTWTEQYAFLVLTGDGTQDRAHLEGATRLRLNGLAAVVE